MHPRLDLQISKVEDAYNEWHMKPLREYEISGIVEVDYSIRKKECTYSSNNEGFWMLYYPKYILHKKWEMLVRLYRNKELTGISYIETSTSQQSPSTGDNNKAIIWLYCGPYQNKELILEYGKNVIEKTRYTNNMGHMSYKTLNQRKIGTRATGTLKNWYYQLQVPSYSPSDL